MIAAMIHGRQSIDLQSIVWARINQSARPVKPSGAPELHLADNLIRG
jgi:hypothetical protein